MTSFKPTLILSGIENGHRVDSRILEERIQKAISEGYRRIEISAHGQHGIGGRLWQAGDAEIFIRVMGVSGQRLGSMGFPNTRIDVCGPVSDDVGWLNAGARIVVHGHAANGAGNAMAQGKIYIAGSIGARGMTMTKHNPRFDPPEMWVLGGVGDSFAEFMAGGTAVVCGHEPQNPANVLGNRPCVGMVCGRIFFRGPHKGFSEHDARIATISDEDWQELTAGLRVFLAEIEMPDLFDKLTANRKEWNLLVARMPSEKVPAKVRSMSRFRREIWDKELGTGGLIGDLTDLDRSPIEVITTGNLRRYVPLWENGRYLPPCQANCPTGIPVQERWQLMRNGHIEEAVNLALRYTPFPAAVCGYLCPNLCMQHCTRQTENLSPVDVTLLGKASLKAETPQPQPSTGRRIAVIGGGPAGLSVAWQLWLKGHEPVIYDMSEKLGGKMTATIPRDRIPDEVLNHELQRIREAVEHVHLQQPLTPGTFTQIRESFDYVVIAVGAQKPAVLNIPGHERAIAALDFLRLSKADAISPGRRIVIIGAGNVGCDVATEAARLGATDITLIDVQEPASFGREREHAEAAGARFLWPRFAKAITDAGVELQDGETLPADHVIFAIGDRPDLSFLPDDIIREKGYLSVNDRFQSSDPRVFAVGDVVRPGLLTEAIGAGRIAAETIDGRICGREEIMDRMPPMPAERVKMAYFDPWLPEGADVAAWAKACASCGSCRDCGLCEAICPQNAIFRHEVNGTFEYRVRAERCIGCGFCAGACPTGVWRLAENEPLE
ncbi:MAG: NAD-dependent dihydropyrimidine dehydrogenase subunit PreT [Syntrophus sp. PtaB.Bin001]|nr:MAG: NAD-dependent dihydropyrimidine dehydrogenase subunit PreT [Syntrophus sp. PtaB.Bin001]